MDTDQYPDERDRLLSERLFVEPMQFMSVREAMRSAMPKFAAVMALLMASGFVGYWVYGQLRPSLPSVSNPRRF